MSLSTYLIIGGITAILGVFTFLYGMANTNIEAPQASDWGNRFIWPGIWMFIGGIFCVICGLVLAFVDNFTKVH